MTLIRLEQQSSRAGIPAGDHRPLSKSEKRGGSVSDRFSSADNRSSAGRNNVAVYFIKIPDVGKGPKAVRNADDGKFVAFASRKTHQSAEDVKSEAPNVWRKRISPGQRSRVDSLTKAVHGIESRLGYQITRPPKLVAPPSPGAESSDGNSSVSDILEADQPLHLRSLFQNDWLSVDSRQQDEQAAERRVKASTHLLETARRALQVLIPPREEVSDISKMGPGWLTIQSVMLPLPFTPKSEPELLESYEEMSDPDVDPIRLASWLLTIALTGQQAPAGNHSSGTQHDIWQRRLALSRAISETVDSTILCHDKLIGTTRGLVVFMQFIRLLIGQGSFQKAWIRLRHVIAIAELMGLPKTFHATQHNKTTGIDDDHTQLCRAQQWELICSADRLLSMVMNIPTDTSRHKQTNEPALIIDGVVQPGVYLRRLTDLAGKIQLLDDLNFAPESSTELYTSALELVRELRALASQTPESWWARGTERVEADHIVQMMHFYISMRVHLPFTMRPDAGEEYFYHRLACMDACESIAHRYLFLRRKLPPGFFLLGILDLQVFSATVVLLLTSHSSSSTNRFNLRIDKTRIDTVVGQVINLMRERSDGAPNSDSAKNAASTLNALNHLLREDDSGNQVHQLTVKVPLLGKVHVRRNPQMWQAPKADKPWFQPQPDTGAWKLNEQVFPASFQGNPSVGTTWGAQEDWQLDRLSWSIENSHENLFQDSLMMDTFDQFAM
ncbi:hypothetical protein N7510_006548 [Penicillium lagena]|uniref:uncharacterized protein n=1 Tax=Penicillium lagena TaxID=94218 RepID=UPI0025415959|nr:uncharacterized protein N7510_006548 [Penicillium lagena]KAJ5613354.1 hypothetical protein N7510_006548 [Penicillium lagena]